MTTQLLTASGLMPWPLVFGAARIGCKKVGTAFLGTRLTLKKDKAVLAKHIRLGVHIDTAQSYGYSEQIIGEFLGNLFQDALVSRKDLLIATKQAKAASSNVRAEVKFAVGKSIEALGVFPDIVYVHEPYPNYMDYVEALYELQGQNRLRYIGLSRFTLDQVAEVREKLGPGVPLVVQVSFSVGHREYFPWEYQSYCQAEGIPVMAYRPLDRSWDVRSEKIIMEVAKRHDSSPQQIILAWLLRQGVYPVLRDHTDGHRLSNIAALDINLSDADVSKLSRLTS